MKVLEMFTQCTLYVTYPFHKKQNKNKQNTTKINNNKKQFILDFLLPACTLFCEWFKICFLNFNLLFSFNPIWLLGQLET